MREISVDLPTFGNPTSATSAISLSSSADQRSSPDLALLGERRARGAGWTGTGRCPCRPCPPARGEPTVAVVHQVGQHLAVVVVLHHGALGHLHDQVVARRAVLVLALAVRALLAVRWGWSRKASSDATLRSATSQTSPPSPPSPPSGPPLGMWASRRIDTQPAPPSPPFTLIAHSSTKFDTRATVTGLSVRVRTMDP